MSASKPSVRVQVQPDLFGGPDVVYGLPRAKKNAPATATNSPGAVTNTQRRSASEKAYRRNSVRGQAK